MDSAEILEQLFDNGYVVDSVEIIPGKQAAKIKTLTPEDYIILDDKIIKQEGSKLKIYQLLALYKLSLAIVEYKGIKFDLTDPKRVDVIFEIISKLANPIIDKFLKAQTILEKQVRSAMKVEEVDDHFFEKADSLQKLEQLPEGSTPAEQKVSENL